MSDDLGRYYADCRQRITALVGDSVGDVPVLATPGWTVHDVVAHLRGVCQDAVAGNMAGAPGEAWTAAQVERGRAKSVAQLVDEWATDAPLVEAVLSSPEGPNIWQAVADVHTHEADLCGALGRRAEVPDAVWRFLVGRVAGAPVGRAAEAGLAPLAITTHEGDRAGADDAPVTVATSRHELLRAVFGRRCPEQVAAWRWSGTDDPMAYASRFAIFGPRTTSLDD
jgi:uncharacterized protein (TIGR03083 family)